VSEANSQKQSRRRS